MSKNFANAEELVKYSQNFVDKTIYEINPNFDFDNVNQKNKGKVGHFVETEIFGYKLNSDQAPDFSNIGVELKVSPMKRLKSQKLVPKERIKLTQLNIQDVIDNEDITKSKTWIKIRSILIIWYLYSQEFKNNKIKYVDLLKLSESKYFTDIKKDWLLIRSYLLDGKAHFISEGATKYLGLARNGSGVNEKKISQPFSTERFYRRAFTLKVSFARRLLWDLIGDEEEKFNPISSLQDQIVGLRVRDLLNEKELKTGKFAKNIVQLGICRKFGVSTFRGLTSYFEEKGNVSYTFKTIPLNQVKGSGEFKIKESFKVNLNILEAAEKEWIDSSFSTVFENKFIIITYIHDKENRLNSIINDIKEVTFNDEDIAAIKNGYEEFRYKYYNGGLIDSNGHINFVKSSDKVGIHFRPSATNSSSESSKFVSAAGEKGVKSALWINNDIIMKKLYGELDENKS